MIAQHALGTRQADLRTAHEEGLELRVDVRVEPAAYIGCAT